MAGCVQDAGPAEAADESLQVDAARPAPVFGEVITGPAVGPDINATTAAAPRLVEGEWWRIRFGGGFIAQDVEVVRVVANATEDGYVFGMPHEGWYKEAIAYHAPAFGDVNLNLSYATHNVLFEPVRFPLKEGDTWTTHFAASPQIAKVVEADQYTATITFEPPADPQPTDPVYAALGMGGTPSMKVVYDARIHEVVHMESMVGTWEVVEHGYDFEGWVTVPRGEHTAIDYGTFGPATPGEPLWNREVAVEGGFNRLTMMHLIVGLAPGNYRLRSVTPDLIEFKTEVTAFQGTTIKFYEAINPDGTWKQEDFVAGAGATYSMGIAYHQFDIQLPGGARRADHSHPVMR